MDKTEIRLQLYLARAGIASRRKCEEYIAQGFVKVNGATVKTPGYKVTDDDIVEYRGREVHQVKKKYYVALHKPVRYLTSMEDDDGRDLAIDLIKNFYPSRLFNVGRLDYMSSGLIFFTNDGEFTKIVSHPSNQIEKEYEVESNKKIPEELLEEFKKGVYIDGEKLKIERYTIVTPVKVRLVLTEGKNREIRRLFYSRNFKVKRLHRIRIGNVRMKNLAPGEFRELSKVEIDWFFRKEK